MNALSPVTWCESEISFLPDPWQQRVLETDAKRDICTCSRQSGKSSTAAALALHTAVHQPGSLILLTAPTDRQSTELFGKVTEFMAKMSTPPILDQDNLQSCRFRNGSRIVALPGMQRAFAVLGSETGYL
jgi:hypothetical protein